MRSTAGDYKHNVIENIDEKTNVKVFLPYNICAGYSYTLYKRSFHKIRARKILSRT